MLIPINIEKQLNSYIEAEKVALSAKDSVVLAFVYVNRATVYSSVQVNKPDSAILLFQKAEQYFSVIKTVVRKYVGNVYLGIGSIYLDKGNLKLAQENFKKAILVSEQLNNAAKVGDGYALLANTFQSLKISDSSLYYSKKALQEYQRVGKVGLMAVMYSVISDIYQDQKNTDSAFAYLKLSRKLNDSLDRVEKKRMQEYQVLGFNEQFRLQQKEQEINQTQNRIRTYALLQPAPLSMER